MKIEPDKFFGRRRCPACGVLVQRNENYCPICRYAFPHPSPVRTQLRIYGSLIVLAALLACLFAR